MKFEITIAVWPAAIHPEGYPTEGKAESLTFDQDEILEILRSYSNIPTGKQRTWEYVSVQFK